MGRGPPGHWHRATGHSVLSRSLCAKSKTGMAGARAAALVALVLVALPSGHGLTFNVDPAKVSPMAPPAHRALSSH